MLFYFVASKQRGGLVVLGFQRSLYKANYCFILMLPVVKIFCLFVQVLSVRWKKKQ